MFVLYPPSSSLQFITHILSSNMNHLSTHCTGSVATSAKGKKKKGSRGKSNRMTEAEEDAQLLKTATSARRTVYLNAQPKLLADHCKMHKYQLEGLNWMIKLHDHGINGILADEMVSSFGFVKLVILSHGFMLL